MYGIYHSPYSGMGMNPVAAMYQHRLQTMQQTQPTAPQSNSFLKCRYVTAKDEAKAAQIEMDGNPNVFYSPAERMVYIKYVGLNGMPVFEEFRYVPPQEPVNANDVIAALQQRIDLLEKKVEGVIVHEQSIRTENGTDETKNAIG